jgi:hypothetical protein
MNPNDFYFDIEEGEEFIDKRGGKSVIAKRDSTFIVVPKKHFDSTGYLDDGVGKIINSTLFPMGFGESAEAMYRYNGDDDEGKEKLIKLGFIYKKLEF